MTTLTETATSVPTGPLTQLEIRDVMTPGVVTIVEDASLIQACRALRRHRVHAVLVVGRHQGTPIGWITARGLLGLLDHDPCTPARDAVVERAVTIGPSATVADAVAILSHEGISHLLVSHRSETLPEGIVSDLDLALVMCRGGS
jgi:CBS domain-containing protein